MKTIFLFCSIPIQKSETSLFYDLKLLGAGLDRFVTYFFSSATYFYFFFILIQLQKPYLHVHYSIVHFCLIVFALNDSRNLQSIFFYHCFRFFFMFFLLFLNGQQYDNSYLIDDNTYMLLQPKQTSWFFNQDFQHLPTFFLAKKSCQITSYHLSGIFKFSFLTEE